VVTKTQDLFAVLRRKREYERAHLPFMHSLIDFDIVVEVGYAQENGTPIAVKQLLLGLSAFASARTVRRRLNSLIVSGVILRRLRAGDHRAAALVLSAPCLRVLERYGALLLSLPTVGRQT
jgi:hypothetical protein